MCSHPPLQRRSTVSTDRCFVMMAEARRSRACSQLQMSICARCSLHNVGEDVFLHELHSVRCFVWRESHPLCHARRFLHSHQQFFKAMKKTITVLAHSLDKNPSSFPKRFAMTSAKHVQTGLPQRSAKKSAKRGPVTREFSRMLHTKTSAKHVRNSCQPWASLTHHSSGHPRNTFQLLASVPCRSTLPPA